MLSHSAALIGLWQGRWTIPRTNSRLVAEQQVAILVLRDGRGQLPGARDRFVREGLR